MFAKGFPSAGGFDTWRTTWGNMPSSKPGPPGFQGPSVNPQSPGRVPIYSTGSDSGFQQRQAENAQQRVPISMFRQFMQPQFMGGMPMQQRPSPMANNYGQMFLDALRARFGTPQQEGGYFL